MLGTADVTSRIERRDDSAMPFYRDSREHSDGEEITEL